MPRENVYEVFIIDTATNNTSIYSETESLYAIESSRERERVSGGAKFLSISFIYIDAKSIKL